MFDEMFDIVDANDRVVGQAPRSEVHARKLLHRAVHVFVFNDEGGLLLQRRGASGDEYALCYTPSASSFAGWTRLAAGRKETGLHGSAAETAAPQVPKSFLHGSEAAQSDRQAVCQEPPNAFRRNAPGPGNVAQGSCVCVGPFT